MAVKTITITESAYGALKALKSESESFSEAIERLTKRRSLMDFFGVLSKESADELEKAMLESRKKQRVLQRERTKRIWGTKR